MTQNSPPAAQKTRNSQRVKKTDFNYQLFIESYGVKICITSNAVEALDAFKKILGVYLPDRFSEIDPEKTELNFLYKWNPGGVDSFYKNGKRLNAAAPREKTLEYFGSEVRRTIAEWAVGRVFIHSGVVSWKGKAIIMPAKSLGGKTSLTAALIKRGALYYSDEYAILDEEGFVHPFPKTLSIRESSDPRSQVEHAVEAIGGKSATEKAPVGMFLLTRYKPRAAWKPKILTPAKGILELINHTLPIRNNPNFVLNVLNRTISGAPVVKSNRGDVSKSVGQILDFFEKNCF